MYETIPSRCKSCIPSCIGLPRKELDMEKNFDSIKWVTLGDASVGKTSLLSRISGGAFPEQLPTANDFVKEVVVDGNWYIVKFLDFHGGEQYHGIRPLAYPGTDIFVLCFDKSQRPSFDNVKETWIPEIRQHMPDTPILLVGNKVDLISKGNSSGPENQDKSAVVTRQEACELAQSIGSSCIEASAVTGENVTNVLITAVRMVVRERNRRRANCRCRPILKWFRSKRHR